MYHKSRKRNHNNIYPDRRWRGPGRGVWAGRVREARGGRQEVRHHPEQPTRPQVLQKHVQRKRLRYLVLQHHRERYTRTAIVWRPIFQELMVTKENKPPTWQNLVDRFHIFTYNMSPNVLSQGSWSAIWGAGFLWSELLWVEHLPGCFSFKKSDLVIYFVRLNHNLPS